MVLPVGDLERSRSTPWGTYTLLALNVLAYLVQVGLGDSFTAAYAATPYEITHQHDIPHAVRVRLHPQDLPLEPAFEFEIPHAPIAIPVWMTMLTAMFLHGNPLHLAGNMLYLWIFGDNVEEVLGTVRYLVVYLACGLLGTLAQVAAAPDSRIPTLGASGAIAGVMGAYVVWFPHYRVRVWVLRVIVEMPALLVIGAWMALQVWAGIGSARLVGKTGGVAYLAHVGGAAGGIAVALMYHHRARELLRRPRPAEASEP